MINTLTLRLLCGTAFLALTSCSGLLPIEKRGSDSKEVLSEKVKKTKARPDPKQKPEPKTPQAALKTYYGTASWYSIKTNHGRTTASGRLLSNGASTAAHKTLPFGTRVRVTSLFNGKSEILRITDRGPHVKNRLIDVTIGCAQRLGFYSRGVTRVKVEVLEWGNWTYKST